MRMMTRPLVILAAIYILASHDTVFSQRLQREHWVGTWATAVDRPLVPRNGRGRAVAFNNQTLRQIVHVSLGGAQVRVVLSNAFGTVPLEVGAASLALRDKESAIVPSSRHSVMFGGRTSTRVAAGAVAISDPVSLTLTALSDLAVDIYLPGDTSSSIVTMHNDAFQTNYVSTTGNHAGESEWPGATTTQSWFFLSAVEVMAPQEAGAVVAFGDSLTDGTRSTPDTNGRWPDHLARRLMMNAAATHTSMMGVLNEAIAGNRVLLDQRGPNALARFDRDVLAQSSVTHVIVLEGINDLGVNLDGEPIPSAVDLIAAHQQLIARAHAHGVKIIGATILPFEGATIGGVPGYYAAEKDERRQAFNEWMRTSKAYDGVVDFDRVVRDPGHTVRLLPQLKAADNLHLNDAGHQTLANAIDLRMLK